MTDKIKLVKCYYLRVFDPPTRAPRLIMKTSKLLKDCEKMLKRYLINHLISAMLSEQCFVFLFRQGTEQLHQGGMNQEKLFLIQPKKYTI